MSKRKLEQLYPTRPTETVNEELLLEMYNTISLSGQALAELSPLTTYPSRYRHKVPAKKESRKIHPGAREACWRLNRTECAKRPECLIREGRSRKQLRTLALAEFKRLTEEAEEAKESKEAKKTTKEESKETKEVATEDYLCEYKSDIVSYTEGNVIEVPAYSRQFFLLKRVANAVKNAYKPALLFENLSSPTESKTFYLIFSPFSDIYARRDYPLNFEGAYNYLCGRWMVAPYSSYLPDVMVHGGTWVHWQSLKSEVLKLMREIADSKEENIKLIIGGFSLGAALAQIAAFDLLHNDLIPSNITNISICSAGSFATGNLGWREWWEAITRDVMPERVRLFNLSVGYTINLTLTGESKTLSSPSSSSSLLSSSSSLSSPPSSRSSSTSLSSLPSSAESKEKELWVIDPITLLPVRSYEGTNFVILPIYFLHRDSHKLISPAETSKLLFQDKVLVITNDSLYDLCTDIYYMISRNELKFPSSIYGESKEIETKSPIERELPKSTEYIWNKFISSSYFPQFATTFPRLVEMMNYMIKSPEPKYVRNRDIIENVNKLHSASFYLDTLRFLLPNVGYLRGYTYMRDWETRNE